METVHSPFPTLAEAAFSLAFTLLLTTRPSMSSLSLRSSHTAWPMPSNWRLTLLIASRGSPRPLAIAGFRGTRLPQSSSSDAGASGLVDEAHLLIHFEHLHLNRALLHIIADGAVHHRRADDAP